MKFSKLMNFKFLITFLFICLSQIAFSGITNTDSIDVVKEELSKADKNTLVIFDCDDVLIHKTDALFSKKNEKEFNKCVKNILMKNPLAILSLHEFVGIVFESVDQILVDEKLPEIVSNLQKNGVKVIVLTAMKNEILNDQWAIDLRINELKKFGFDFSKSWGPLKEKFFGKDGDSQYYKSGIVCSKPGDKGDAIELFLKHSKFKPSKIIFIDDRRNNLVNAEKKMEELGIKLKGIEYISAHKIPCKFEFSEDRTMFQLKYLMNNKKWLSDEKAETELAKQPMLSQD